VLASKSGGFDAQKQAEQEIALSTAFARELQSRRWPMSKIIADVAGALPVGVVIESVRVEVGQRVAVQGSADSLELVNHLQAKLNESGVFAEASVDRTQTSTDAAGVRFDVSARVVRPFNEPKGLEDFAASTLSQRLYGERAGSGRVGDGATATASSPTSEDRPAGRSRRAATTGAEESSGSAAAPRDRARSAAAPEKKADIPPPISDEEIAKLDANAAMKEWTSRQRASKQSGIDQATRDRLKGEAEKSKSRMTEARSQTKSGGGS
jgi:hypothetical protein